MDLVSWGEGGVNIVTYTRFLQLLWRLLGSDDIWPVDGSE